MLDFRGRDKSLDDSRPEVKDVLDYDRTINRRVIEFTKDWIGRWATDVRPDTQLDTAAELRINTSIEKLDNMLDARTQAFERLYGMGGAQSILLEQILKENNNTTFIKLYNDVIRIYKGVEVNQMTREAMKKDIQKLSPNISAVVFILNKYLTTVYALPNANATFQDRFIMRLVNTLNIYQVVEKALFRDSYDIITEGSIAAQQGIYYNDLTVGEKLIFDRAKSVDVMELGKAATPLRKEALKEADANLKRRIGIIESDQNTALSQSELGTIRNLIFGRPINALTQLTPEEIAQLTEDAENTRDYNVLRSQDVEALRQSIEQRVLRGLPPNEIVPEYLPKEEYAKGIVYIKPTIARLKKSFENQLKVAFGGGSVPQNIALGMRNAGGADNNNVVNEKNIKPVKRLKQFCEDFWANCYEIMNKRPPSAVEIQEYKDDANADFTEINDAALAASTGPNLDYGRVMGDRPAIRDDLSNLIDETLGYADDVEAYYRKYYAENPLQGMVGDGKRKHNKHMDYEDGNNEHYRY